MKRHVLLALMIFAPLTAYRRRLTRIVCGMTMELPEDYKRFLATGLAEFELAVDPGWYPVVAAGSTMAFELSMGV